MNEETINILIIEDDPAYVRFIEEMLNESNRITSELSHFKRLKGALKRLAGEMFDVALLDLNLPDSWGFETFDRLYAEFPSLPIVVLTGQTDDEIGVKAVQKGAQDYLNKGEVDGNLLTRTIQYAIERKRAQAELEKSHQKFYNLSAHLQHLREEERKYIAGELHDELGGLFTAIKMELYSAFDTKGKNQESFLEMKDSMTKLIDKGIEIVRRISTDLRPHILDHLGLLPAINWYIKEFYKRTKIICTWALCKGDIPLDKDRALAVFRILQEALTNVARHSKASKVSVEVKREGDTMTLRVEDNGRGIDEGKINDPHSFGLMGIQERVLYLQGSVSIKGVPDKGTTVMVTIPLSEAGKRAK